MRGADTRLASTAIGVATLLATWRAPAIAAPDARARPTLADVAPVIDGRLDDAAWKSATAYGGFVERTPLLRGEPAEETTFRVLVDGDALYVAVECRDSRPDAIRGRTLQRDSDAIFDDDDVSVKIDPTRDRRTTYGFVLNAAGGRIDYRGLNEETWQFEWDAVWDGAVARNDEGWTVEMRIPWVALGIDPTSPPAATGFEISRDQSRLHATYDWALIAPPHSPIGASQYGVLEGLPELLPTAPRRADRKTWALIPWGLVGYRQDAAGKPIEAVADGGLDVEGELGNGFAGTLTLNTDFAEVEVDDVVTNLTRFDLFLPEKRGFFLKDGDLFAFGEPGWATLFHSRTIGLAQADDGSVELPILAGLKVGGRTQGGFRLGALSVLTRPAHGLPWRLDSVLRLQQAFTDGSVIGMMATDRQSLEDADEHNVDVGVDGQWRPEGTKLVVQGFALGSRESTATRDGALYDGGAMINLWWRGEVFEPRVTYSYFGPSLKSDLGYFERTGIHNIWSWLGVTPQLGWCGLQQLQVALESDIYLDAPGAELLDWGEELYTKLQWDAGYYVGVNLLVGAETVDAFAIADEHDVAAGVHAQNRVKLLAGTPTTEAVSLSGELFAGEYYGGDIRGFRGTLIARPGTALRVQLAGESDWIDLPSGAFVAPTINLRLESGLAANLALSGFVGWSGLASQLSLQTRLRWSFAAGSDLFAVWELALDDSTGSVESHSLIGRIALRWP